MDKNNVDAGSTGHHMARGSFWMIAARWGVRLTGVISTVILARLLSPSDYGVVAIAMIFVGFLEILNQTGQTLAIVRLPAPDRADYDTCWTMSIISGLLIATLIAAASPLISLYFHNTSAMTVALFLSLRSAIGGFENVGVLNFRRNFEFNKNFIYTVVPKVFQFFVTITSAFILRNYWALVIGMISIVVFTVSFSYMIHPYRPSFTLKKLKHLFSFSYWTFARTLGWYLNAQVDLFAIGRMGATTLGGYSVASDLASLPSRELNDPIVWVLYPVMSRVQGDKPKVKALYLNVLAWSALICLSTSTGVAMAAHDLTLTVLGKKWLDVEPLIPWLSLAAGMLGLSSGAYTAFDALGIPKQGAKMQWVRLAMLIVAVFPISVIFGSRLLVAIARLLVTVVFMPTLFIAAGRLIGASFLDYWRSLSRPALAAIAMALALNVFNSWATSMPLGHLVVSALIGLSSFSSALFLLWWLVGKPDGPESQILAWAGGRWRVFAA